MMASNSPASSLASRELTLPRRFDDLERGKGRAQLALAAQAGGADARAGRQRRQLRIARRHEGVARVLARADHRDDEAVRQADGDVLEGMNRDVGASFQEGLFQLLDEQPLAADLGERAVEDPVPWVVMVTSSTASPGWCRPSPARTNSACHRASGLLRVPMRRRVTGGLELVGRGSD
jgi:hypothetical protein